MIFQVLSSILVLKGNSFAMITQYALVCSCKHDDCVSFDTPHLSRSNK